MADDRIKFMTGEEYVEIVFALGENLQSVGRRLRLSQRSTYRYAYDPAVKIPGPTADILRLLKAGVITFEQIEKVRPKTAAKPASKTVKKTVAKKK